MYKVVIVLPDGTRDEQDEVFETEEAAHDFGLEWCSNYEAGGEVLHQSNPGDHPLPDEDDDDVDYEVIEVNR